MITSNIKEGLKCKCVSLYLFIISCLLLLLVVNHYSTPQIIIEEPEIGCIYWEMNYTMLGRLQSQLMCNNDKVVRRGQILPLPSLYDGMKDSIDAKYERLLKELPVREE